MESSKSAGDPATSDTAGAAFAPDRPLAERAATLLAGGADLPITSGGGWTGPVVRFGVQRARDLLVLDVEARGMQLDTPTEGDPVLSVAAGQGDKARLIVSFPPQHVGEQAWLENENPSPDVLAAARFARFSRLVYLVPAGEQIVFSSEGVLAAMRRLELAVVPVAKPRATPARGTITGKIALPGGLTIGTSAIGAVLSTTSAKDAARRRLRQGRRRLARGLRGAALAAGAPRPDGRARHPPRRAGSSAGDADRPPQSGRCWAAAG